MRKEKTIVLGVTASIAIYKACDLLRRLKEASYGVHVVMTPEAKTLVHPVVFQSLSGNQVHHEFFKTADLWEIEHVSLAQRADLVLIAPATAHIIAKVAHGLCDDMVSCVVSATEAPVCFAPAMNERMWQNPATQGNVGVLESFGYRIIPPRKGMLACGKEGVGCLAHIETILQVIQDTL
jgi:phosphopantothenoylcysteine decarboxylase/phosphopantothenate--cysteine ligase